MSVLGLGRLRTLQFLYWALLLRCVGSIFILRGHQNANGESKERYLITCEVRCEVNLLFNVTFNDFSVIYVTVHSCARRAEVGPTVGLPTP